MIVYTCITNQKDALQPLNREDGVEYICFSDRPFKHPVWQYRPVQNFDIGNPRRVARMYKILSHRWFGDEPTIWIDGRVRPIHKPSFYLDKYKGIVCARKHHARKCIYAEAAEIKRINYDDAAIVNSHINRLKNAGYPTNHGLHETGMLLRRPGCEAFNERLWALLSTGSMRDQLSFDYVAWELSYDIEDIDRSEVFVSRHLRVTNAKL